MYKGAEVKFSGPHSFSVPGKGSRITHFYSGIQTGLRSTEISGPFDKIGVVFNELGINHFIDCSLIEILSKNDNKSFSYFASRKTNPWTQIYQIPDYDKKIELLDTFFLNEFRPFENQELKNIVELILSSDSKLRVKHITSTFQINSKKLLRDFNKHLCCTPKEYIDVVQFRRSLNDYMQAEGCQTLTQLAYNRDYYDQAQFTNHFKRLSGRGPKELFRKIKKYGDEDVFWVNK